MIIMDFEQKMLNMKKNIDFYLEEIDKINNLLL
jgi:hypothetical protein